jgi:hypothetical protein
VQDIIVEDMRVPSGATCIALLHATMHDAAIYKEPEQCAAGPPRACALEAILSVPVTSCSSCGCTRTLDCHAQTDHLKHASPGRGWAGCQEDSSLYVERGGHARRFEPERFLAPRNEGKDESGKDSNWTGFWVRSV